MVVEPSVAAYNILELANCVYMIAMYVYKYICNIILLLSIYQLGAA